MEIELVVARYREAVAWTRNVPAAVRVTIYDKGQDLAVADFPHARIVPRANRGHEAETYLHHLVERYDTLAERTVFCQGHPFDHAPDLHPVLRRLAAGDGSSPEIGFTWLGFVIDSDDPRGLRLFVPWSKNQDRRELELDRFHRQLFAVPPPPLVRFYPGAQFVLSRTQARRQDRELYQRALELSTRFPDAGHCFERLWDRLFGVDGVAAALAPGELTRYLKPIRRLASGPDGGGSDPAFPGG